MAVIGKRNCDAGFEEIVLEMGNGHGFLYKPYEDWVGPLVKWALK
jgi:hypothetical protein